MALGGSRWRSGSSPALCTTEPGFDPRSHRCTCIGFQSILASAGFYLGSSVFLLHLKLGFLNKSVSGIIWSLADILLIWSSADMALCLESFGRYVARYKIQIYYYYCYHTIEAGALEQYSKSYISHNHNY